MNQGLKIHFRKGWHVHIPYIKITLYMIFYLMTNFLYFIKVRTEKKNHFIKLNKLSTIN